MKMTRENSIELIETHFPKPDPTSENLLQTRIGNASRNNLSRLWIAAFDSLEIGYVILDFWEKSVGLVVYELFLLPTERRKGYGTKILKEVLEMARALGYERVIVRPNPIESTSDKLEYQRVHEQLVRWYKKLGFSESKDGQMDCEV
jgi:GNAT superfamily N-acetyltransferase